MSALVIDLRNYRDRSGARVPEGSYLVSIEEVEVGQSKKLDTMLTVYLRIIGGDQDGMTLVDRLTMTEKAMFRVVGFLNGMGVKTPRKQIKIDPEKLAGRRVRVEVKDGEPYNGTIRSEVKSYVRIAAPAGDEGGEDLDGLGDEPEDTAAAPEAPEKRPAATPADTVDDLDVDLDDLEGMEV